MDRAPGSAADDVSAHQEQTRRMVRAMMTLTGQSASGLAKAAGLTPSTLNRFMHAPVRHTLSQRTMLALMTETFVRIKDRPRQSLDTGALAELGPAIAVYERGVVDIAPEVKAAIGAAKAIAGGGSVPVAAEAALPVLLAATQGIDVKAGDFGQAPLKTPRPPFLESDPIAFALLMPDQSMTPRFDAGDMLYVSPRRSLDGDRVDVVVDRVGGGFTVGGLIAAAETVRIATLSPRTRQSYTRDKIRGVYRIVGVQRLGG